MNQPQTNPEILQPTPNPLQQQRQMMEDLKRNVRGGASNFYWIAGFSLVNTALAFFENDLRFVIGLLATQVVDMLAIGMSAEMPELAGFLTMIAIAINLVLVAFFALFGFLGGKGNRILYVMGMVLYALDGVLSLVFQDWISALFHAYFLWGLWGGLQALNALKQIEESMPVSAVEVFD
jgi:hypothetical protein